MSDKQDSGKFEYKSEKRELKRRYLKRAFEENRGAEAIAALNKYYNNISKTKAPSDDEICADLGRQASDGFFHDATLEGLQDAAGPYESKYVRAFNMAQYLEGAPYRWREEGGQEGSGKERKEQVIVHPGPKTLQ